MKFCTMVALIVCSVGTSIATAQIPQQKSYEEMLKELMEKPYTGETLDAINGARSPEGYKVKADDDQETRLQKQIVNAIYMELESKRERVESGQEQVFFLLRAFRRLHQAREALHANDLDQLIKVAQETIQSAKRLEAIFRMRLENGIGRPDDWAEALAYRLQCELHLQQLKSLREGR